MSNLTQPPGNPVPDPDLYGVDGNVVSMARSGNTLYIAGSFRSIGENTGGYVPLDVRTGELLRPFPKVAGSVYAIVPDGTGGWYIGGEFTAVAGKPRSCLAQVLADGSVSDWNPSVTGSPGFIDPPSVSAIAVDGDRVFLGGGFRQIGGQSQENLGCVDARTGAVLEWNHGTHIDGFVSALATSGGTVFVGGTFDSIGGQPRARLAAVDVITGAVMPWRADVAGWVNALVVKVDTLYVGGTFVGINAQNRALLAAIDITTGQLLSFDAHASGVEDRYGTPPEVAALAMVRDTLYVGGNFTQIGGQIRSSIAALDAATGTGLAWAPDTLGPRFVSPPVVQTLAVGHGAVYVGGGFETVAGASHPNLTVLDAETGRVTEWNPKPKFTVYAMALQGDTLRIGGLFNTVGEWRHRAGVAAIDLVTGALKPWNPNPDGAICTAVAVKGDRVFVSGDFTAIGGQPQPRNSLAALDTINGEVTNWDPGANSVASAFLVQGDTLYLGGWFTQVGGQTRNGLAAINTTTGEVTSWNPNASFAVLAMSRSESTLYVGGLFDQIGGQGRHGIAAVDAVTGLVTPWNPDTDNSTVESVLASGNTIYVGGGFNQIGGRPRRGLAALDAGSGVATAWNPNATEWDLFSPRIRALALSGSELYVGGDFAGIGGQPRICLAAVDTATGLATSWDPGADGLVWSLATEASTLYVGGGFTRAGGLPSAGLAAFSIPWDPVPDPISFSLAQSAPNPTNAGAIIRYALPRDAAVTLSVYDLQGRLVVTLLDHVLQSAGRHDVPVQTAPWKPGVYLYRIDAGGRSATRKLVVVG